MNFVYRTQGTCSRAIRFDIEGDIITNVRFDGGCNGNLQGIGKLVEGLTVDQIESRLQNISCNGRPTSCPDQLAKAVRQAYEQSQKKLVK